jgi:predicted transcriptional regulator
MPHSADDIPNSELRVLEVLWERGTATVREITDWLYAHGGVSKRATVLKLLERLEAKGFVRRDRSTSTQRFAVEVDRDTLIGNQLRRIADRLGGSSFAPLLAHLVHSADLTDQERQELRGLLAAAEPARPQRVEADRKQIQPDE